MINGVRVWVASYRIPYTLEAWKEVFASCVPETATCVHVDRDAGYTYSVWVAQADRHRIDFGRLLVDWDNSVTADSGTGALGPLLLRAA